MATHTQVPIISGPDAVGIAPDVSGLRVVWEDRREGFSKIYLHDLVTGEEFQITSGLATARDPRISGNRIVWNDYRDDPTGDTFLFEIATTPVACIAAVRARLDEYETGGEVANAGIAESLRALLDQAESAAGRGNATAAGNVLRAFIRSVEAQSGRHVDPAAATTLSEMAEAAIGCL